MTMNDTYDYNEYAYRCEEEIAKEAMAKAFASVKLKNNKL